MKFTITWMPSRKRWRLSYRISGKQHRVNFKSKALAEGERDRLKGELASSGAVWLATSPADRNEMMVVAAEVKAAGLTLRQVWENYRRGQMTDGAPGMSAAIGDVRDELVAIKEQANCSDGYVASLRQILTSFAYGREQQPMNRITLADVETFENRFSLHYRSTIRSRLRTWFKFGVRRGYCTADPCARLEPLHVPRGAPATLTVPQVKKSLEWLTENGRAAAWFILTTFAGLRPEEAQKTSPAMLNFKEGWIRVEAQTSKVRERRVVYPMPGVMAKLRKVLKQGAIQPLTRKQLQIERNGLRMALGLNRWPQDCTRHTAASMWLASSTDSATVAHSLGHSEAMLHRRYKALKTQAEAEKFWALVTHVKRVAP